MTKYVYQYNGEGSIWGSRSKFFDGVLRLEYMITNDEYYQAFLDNIKNKHDISRIFNITVSFLHKDETI